MKLYANIYFSPTGGTRRVADALSEGLYPNCARVDLSNPQTDFRAISLGAQDLCLIAVPSYGGRVPALVLERLRLLRPNGARAILVAVYGNREYEDTLLELKDEAEAIGFRVAAAVAAVAEHSIVRRFGAGRPDEDDEAQLLDFSLRIRDKLLKFPDYTLASVPGNRPYRVFGGSSAKPVSDGPCTGHGLCARLCPVGAISLAHPEKTDFDRCITCMRCVSVCPAHSRAIPAGQLAGLETHLAPLCAGRKPNTLFL